MLSSSRRSSSILSDMAASARRRPGRNSRPRASNCPLLLEALEERVLLSKGSTDGGGGPSGDPTTTIPRSQVVQIKVTDLLADGIAVPVQSGGIQNGQIQALR